MDTQGDSLWSHSYNKATPKYIDAFFSIRQTLDSGFVLVGCSGDTSQTVWVVKTDVFGCDTPGCREATGITNIRAASSSFNLYPNPALTQTTVLYRLPENIQQVNLFVYDITGRKVEQIPLNKYTNQITLDVGDLQSGMYLIELKTDDGVVVKKLVKE